MTMVVARSFRRFAMGIIVIVTRTGQHHHAVVQATPPKDLPAQALERFRRKALLKDSSHPVLQHIPHGAPSFVLGGKTIAMADLTPLTDLFTPDAVVTMDGVPQTSLPVFVYQSQTHPNVRVILDDKKNLIKAYSIIGTSDSIDLLPVDATTFAQVNSATDVDTSALGEYEMVCAHDVCLETFISFLLKKKTGFLTPINNTKPG